MSTQAEITLENNLVTQLQQLGYEKIAINNESELLANLKTQLEVHNQTTLSDNDFKQILAYINKGNIFQRAKTLRDRIPYTNANGETKTVELLNQVHWCQNRYQVVQQIKMEGSYKNRYDVTLLINGLPLVQIELKRRGLELKEAFNQTNRYQRHSYTAGHGLFQFIQVFVISNGVNTKYYANNALKDRNFKQTFYWAKEDNTLITQLSDFANAFLERCHISKIITKYVVLNESQKMLMVLRPYQYYATEAIIERVKAGNQFGYIWHTTGSGKTLTSFKTAQILTQLDGVHKVVFVVDRKDLDYQTTKEFNSFSTGSIDGTNNTKALVKQLTGDTPLIVTTIQKLNAAIKGKHLAKMETLKDKRIVFIFDECHRSQFGDTHKAIKTFFTGSQMFGFTGTPIFDENAGSNKYGRRTTDHLFTKCLHKYVITDAIRDGNVLKFSIEYINTFKKKDNIIDIEVEAIDENEVMEADVRLNAVTDYIIAHHHRKTHSKEFTAIFCAPNIPTLIKYYKLFREKQLAGEHNLRVATIFSYRSNEEDKDVGTNYGGEDEFADDEDAPEYNTHHTRDELEDFIQDYNARYGTNFTNKDSHSFYNYYNDIARRVKNREVDILLVVNMFLTGFDSKPLNTLYVDKNLKHHGLIQAYSRTNRILNEKKSQGNIISFRNLKPATDEAIALFSHIEDKKEIIIQPYEEYIETFNRQYAALLLLAPTIDSVNNLPSEDEELNFVKAFRELIRIKNVLSTFTEFTFEDLAMDEQQFEDYKSKYLDLYDKAKSHNRKEKVSILNDVDFELELIHRDEVNVAYILRLLAQLKTTEPEKQPKQEKEIIELIAGDTQLRSKRELIERFIENNLPALKHADEIPEAFGKYWSEQRDTALNKLSVEEGLDKDKLEKVIADFLYTEKRPLSDDIIAMMHRRPRLKERATTAERITNKLLSFVETFISGIEE